MNYKTCTLEELACHVLNNSTQAITQQLIHYQRVGNAEVVKKIKKARILAKQILLLAAMEALDAE